MGKTYRSNLKKGKSKYEDRDVKNIYASKSCSHHGTCYRCESDRTYSTKRKAVDTKEQLHRADINDD